MNFSLNKPKIWIGFKPFDLARFPIDPKDDYKNGDLPAWFINGQLNACYNAVDRWAIKTLINQQLFMRG